MKAAKNFDPTLFIHGKCHSVACYDNSNKFIHKLETPGTDFGSRKSEVHWSGRRLSSAELLITLLVFRTQQVIVPNVQIIEASRDRKMANI